MEIIACDKMAKIFHILCALGISVFLAGIGHYLHWDWANVPITILFGIYAVAILFSSGRNPVPLSRTANERYDAYILYCHMLGKKPSYARERDDIWIPKLPYPVEVMAGFFRLGVAMRRWAMTRKLSYRRYLKLQSEVASFVRSCQANTLDAQNVLDDLILRTWPNIIALRLV